MFKVGYLLAPLVSVWFGFTGWPWWAIFLGMCIGLGLLALDAVAMAIRASHLGIGGRFLAEMIKPLIAMVPFAAIWHGAGYGLGVLAATLIR